MQRHILMVNARLRRAVMQRLVRPWINHGRASELAKQDAEMQKPMNQAGQAACRHQLNTAPLSALRFFGVLLITVA